MKVVLFCGGQGLRLRDASAVPVPEPLIPVGDQPVLASYGDQLSDSRPDLRIAALRRPGHVASLLSVKPHRSTHTIAVDPAGVVRGVKPMGDGTLWINGGYLVSRHDDFDHIRPGEDLGEEPFARLIAAEQLLAERYEGFWAPMDTLKDEHLLDGLAATPMPPWAVWLDPGPAPLPALHAVGAA